MSLGCSPEAAVPCTPGGTAIPCYITQARLLLQQRLPQVKGNAEVADAPDSARGLWLAFFGASWRAGAPYTLDELRRDARLTAERPLTAQEVALLGVDVPSCKLLVEEAPPATPHTPGCSPM